MKPVFAASLLAMASLMFGARANQLTPDRLDMLDKRGYFTPEFKAATYRLVTAREAITQAQAEQKSFSQQLPLVRKTAAAIEAKTAALRQELVRYDRPEENDFNILQAAMQDAAAKPSEQMVLAQAYVWTYPTSPHAADAERDLQMIQQRLAGQKQAEVSADTSRVGAHAQLVARARAHDLNLTEWRDFLRAKSQDELIGLLGSPSSKDDNYWYYNGGWVKEADGRAKAALQINFEAGRVIAVDEKPSSP